MNARAKYDAFIDALSRPLFDCSPAMAAKLARCEAMAQGQHARTVRQEQAGTGMTWQDEEIVACLRLPVDWSGYIRNLNA